MAQTRATIETVLEEGVRCFDASPEYDQAGVRLGPVVEPIRDKVFLVTKSYAVEAREAERDPATALRQRRTDPVDLFLPQGHDRRAARTAGRVEPA